MLTMEQDQIQDHHHVFSDPGHVHGYDNKYPFWEAHVNGLWGPQHSDMIFCTCDLHLRFLMPGSEDTDGEREECDTLLLQPRSLT